MNIKKAKSQNAIQSLIYMLERIADAESKEARDLHKHELNDLRNVSDHSRDSYSATAAEIIKGLEIDNFDLHKKASHIVQTYSQNLEHLKDKKVKDRYKADIKGFVNEMIKQFENQKQDTHINNTIQEKLYHKDKDPHLRRVRT